MFGLPMGSMDDLIAAFKTKERFSGNQKKLVLELDYNEANILQAIIEGAVMEAHDNRRRDEAAHLLVSAGMKWPIVINVLDKANSALKKLVRSWE